MWFSTIKDILKAVANVLLDRKKEQNSGYEKDDTYPHHDKLVNQVNEEIRLKKILGISNPAFQQAIVWAVNNDKQRVRNDKVKYFDRHIKNDGGILQVDEKNIKAQGRVALFMIFCASLMLILAQICLSNKDLVLTVASIGAFFLFLLLAMISGLTPTGDEIAKMREQLTDYNNRDTGSEQSE